MITIDNHVEIVSPDAQPENAADPAGAQQVWQEENDCPACREAEAELMALLERYRGTVPPPLDPELEQRLLDACTNCDPSIASTTTRPVFSMLWPSEQTQRI